MILENIPGLKQQYLIPLFLLFMLFSACKPEATLVKFRGETMGTYYEISYISEQGQVNYQKQIDSLLLAFNNSVSTYIPTSLISKVNQANAGDTIPVDEFFAVVFITSAEVHRKTGGAFDPSVMPLVNAWGFGYQKKPLPADSLEVDSLLKLVNFSSFALLDNPYRIVKTVANTQLDFSAIAKGYGVDVIGLFLEDQKISNYLVDIGGELRARGVNTQQKAWTVGIDKPVENATKKEVQEIVRLKNSSIATSGNYRKFYEKDGVKYAHTIDPKTGYPKLSNLLSASVFTSDCMTADAYATAFMVMGYEKARAYVERDVSLDALFIFSNEKGELQTFATQGVEVLKEDGNN